MISDTPMHRTTIDEMTLEEVDLFLAGLRERRLNPIRMYEEEQSKVKLVKDARLKEKMEKQLSLMKKEIERLDSCMTKIEQRMVTIRMIRFELDLT